MENKQKNPNIHCTVTSCRNHCGSENYCTLNAVSIGTHEPHPTKCECVDCNSFECKGCN